jgi:hypothetical protein
MLIGIWSLSTVSYAAGSSDDENGRYVLYMMEIENNEAPLLLDSKTGKMWTYEKSGALDNEKFSFKGITVEGLAYGSGRLKEIKDLMNEWHVRKFIDKNLKGFYEGLIGEFSYYLDLDKVRQMNRQKK